MTISGLATQNGVCTNKKQSIVEDHFEFSLVAVAAHELGHRYLYNIKQLKP